MGLLDNITRWFTSETSRNKNSALAAGLLFFTGWWILIDAMAGDSHYQITTGHVFIGIFGTISFCMINTVKGEHISDDNSSESGARIAKIWLLIGFVMGFASIIAAIWVMVDDFVNNEKKDTSLGVALLLQNVFILFGSLVYKFGRNEEDWNE
ncbi:transmembrane protein 50A [Drosophila novamexicana]|uniref:transmembrane protein 50A n=1 Tax=Drosophila novamexicana TaxID=47314 RepID=UPI0011E5CDD1|nr:transmembrane protein 50A [Drosophila novamexicana]